MVLTLNNCKHINVSYPRRINVNRNLTNAIPISKPTTAPPIDAIKTTEQHQQGKAPVTNTPTAILNEIIPAASFNNDSPSRIVIAPFGKTFPLVIACTATASVGKEWQLQMLLQ